MQPRLCSRPCGSKCGSRPSSTGVVLVPPQTSQTRKGIYHQPRWRKVRLCLRRPVQTAGPLFLLTGPTCSEIITRRTAHSPALWPICSPAATMAGSPSLQSSDTFPGHPICLTFTPVLCPFPCSAFHSACFIILWWHIPRFEICIPD